MSHDQPTRVTGPDATQPDGDRERHATTTARTDETTHAEEGISQLSRRRDPSLRRDTSTPLPADVYGRGVAWVRPSDLIAQTSAHWAGRGISLQAELGRRARRVPGRVASASRTALRDTAREQGRRLPPVSAFGRSQAGSSAREQSRTGLW